MAFNKRNKPRRDSNNEPPKCNGRSMKVRDGQDAGQVMRRLTRKLKEDGLFDEIRKREFFVSKSDKRKTAKARAKSRERKRVQKMQDGLVQKSDRPKNNRGKKTKKAEQFDRR